MPEYEVTLYYTGFVNVTVEAGSEEEAIIKARNKQDAPVTEPRF